MKCRTTAKVLLASLTVLSLALSALAEDERERIHKRASDGRKAARRAGVRFGRKPKLNTTQQARARELVGKGWGLRAVAAEMNVHHATIARLR